jgi:hypothetical protein
MNRKSSGRSQAQRIIFGNSLIRSSDEMGAKMTALVLSLIEKTANATSAAAKARPATRFRFDFCEALRISLLI